MKPTPIVIPLHHRGGKYGDDTELRFTLRSIAQHFQGDHEVAIVGRRLPDWVQGVRHIPSEKGLKRAVRDAAIHYPDGFLWWYDDCVLLRDASARELRITPVYQGWATSGTRWGKMLEKVRGRLLAEGLPCRDYSRPHGPYWFDQSMVDESFEDWPGMKSKFPFELWILNKRRWPGQPGLVAQYYGKFTRDPAAAARHLNYNDGGNTPELIAWLRARFPSVCRFEAFAESAPVLARGFFIHIPKTAGKSILQAADGVLAAQSRVTHRPWSDPRVPDAWRRVGSPPIVACVRDPLDRAISAYRWFRETRFPVQDEPHRVLGEWFRRVSFSDFWETADVGSLAEVVKHLRPQSSFLEGAPGELRVLRFETLEDDFRGLALELGITSELPRVNVSRGPVPDVSAKARARIRSFYAEDYRRWYE